MCSDVAIRVTEAGKCYSIYGTPRDRLLQLLPWAQRYADYRPFWALRTVSFEVYRGETLGIVGRNGSGKSTLLQLICGTLEPTEGDIQCNGRIAALLELGSGFNPEFTGRENVFMNAAILGLSAPEIEARYDAIAAFADIGDFLEQPVKTYSSGMALRLAFAVQAQIDPDVLIVDEALSVGDARFQAKCFERLRQLKERGTSILLVTHAAEQVVTHCDRALLLDAGRPLALGKPRPIVNRYLDILFGKPARPRPVAASAVSGDAEGAFQAPAEAEVAAKNSGSAYVPEETFARQDSGTEQRSHQPMPSQTEALFATRHGYNPHEYRWGDRAAEILDFHWWADGELFPSHLCSGQRLALALGIRFSRTVVRPVVGITLKTKEGVTVYGCNTEIQGDAVMADCGHSGTAVVVHAEGIARLGPGDYFVSVGVASREGDDIVPHDRRYDAIHLTVFPVDHFLGLINLDMQLRVSTTCP